MSRAKILHQLFDARGGFGLEIGPSFNPLLPKSDGYNVETLDHLDDEGLREKYRNAPGIDTSRIEMVDYVSDGGSIAKLIGQPARYDFCVALHVIEHTIDLIGFLKDCDYLLKPDGVLVLAVPDKRFAFDTLRPRCTAGDILQAHLDGRSSHSLGKLFDELAYNCTRNGAAAWGRKARGSLQLFRPFADARAILEAQLNAPHFIDIHAWQFTPSSFRLAMMDLHALGIIELKERAFLDHREGEFFMTLSRSADGCPEDRLTLARRSATEEAALIA